MSILIGCTTEQLLSVYSLDRESFFRELELLGDEHPFECMRLIFDMNNNIALFPKGTEETVLKVWEQVLDRLQSETELQKQKLLYSAIRLMKKKEFLHTLEKAIKKLIKVPDTFREKILQDLLHEIKTFNDEVEIDETETNSDHLRETDNTFIIKLHKLHPSFTPMETKVCRLLRLNYSTKQIAEILHVTPRSIENHRSRLRKKLGLSLDVSLAFFLASL